MSTMHKRWSQRLADRLMTTDTRRRLVLWQVVTAMLVMTVCVLTMQIVVWMGEAPPALVRWWTAFALGGLVAFFILIRSGAAQRFGDPSLTQPQILYAITIGAIAYGFAGPLRGSALPTVLVALMYGAFQLRPRTVGWVSTYTLALYAAIMVAMSLRRPSVYQPIVELGHFLVLAACVFATSVLAARLSRLRERLRRQKHDLAQALSRVQELSTRDELTGLVNRRHMVELLEQERQRSVRSGRTFCIALVDIDHFKFINDHSGHAAGDDVLRGFARAAGEVVRMSDVLARWGGDEFVLVLSDSRAPLARTGLERLRERVAALVIRAGGIDLRITLSIGLTEHIAGETVAQALERADRALYDAKAQGRNRVAVL